MNNSYKNTTLLLQFNVNLLFQIKYFYFTHSSHEKIEIITILSVDDIYYCTGWTSATATKIKPDLS